MRSLLFMLILAVGLLSLSGTATAQQQVGSVAQGATNTEKPSTDNKKEVDFKCMSGEVEVDVLFERHGSPPIRTTRKRYKKGEGFNIKAPAGYHVEKLTVTGVAATSTYGFNFKW